MTPSRILWEEIRPEHGHVLVSTRHVVRERPWWHLFRRRRRTAVTWFLAIQNGSGDVVDTVCLCDTLDGSMRMALRMGWRPTHHAQASHHEVHLLPEHVEALGKAWDAERPAGDAMQVA